MPGLPAAIRRQPVRIAEAKAHRPADQAAEPLTVVGGTLADIATGKKRRNRHSVHAVKTAARKTTDKGSQR